MKIEARRVIAAPPERIWQELADLNRWAGWMPGVQQAALLSEQADGVGRRQRLTIEGSFGRTEVEQEIIAWDPNRRIAWRDLHHIVEGEERVFMTDVITAVLLEPTGDGTMARVIGTGRPRGVLGWVLNLLIARWRVKSIFRDMLDNLASVTVGPSAH